MAHIHPFSRLRRFRRQQSGAALVEFGLLLPLMMAVFAVMVEGSRTFWSYQAVISGVRDASRYLSRVAPRDICSAGGSVSGYNATFSDIVTQSLSGDSFLPAYITVTSVTASHTCPAGTFRGGAAPIATVTANLTIQYPFAGLFTLVGATLNTTTTSVSDQIRIYGI